MKKEIKEGRRSLIWKKKITQNNCKTIYFIFLSLHFEVNVRSTNIVFIVFDNWQFVVFCKFWLLFRVIKYLTINSCKYVMSECVFHIKCFSSFRLFSYFYYLFAWIDRFLPPRPWWLKEKSIDSSQSFILCCVCVVSILVFFLFFCSFCFRHRV